MRTSNMVTMNSGNEEKMSIHSQVIHTQKKNTWYPPLQFFESILLLIDRLFPIPALRVTACFSLFLSFDSRKLFSFPSHRELQTLSGTAISKIPLTDTCPNLRISF